MWQLEGKVPPSNMVLMEMLSTEYGWTPKEIRELNVVDVKCYAQIISTKRKLENNKQKRNGNK